MGIAVALSGHRDTAPATARAFRCQQHEDEGGIEHGGEAASERDDRGHACLV
jgi:hypothetical protein